MSKKLLVLVLAIVAASVVLSPPGFVMSKSAESISWDMLFA